MRTLHSLLVLLLTFFLLPVAFGAGLTQYDQLVVFGDSLSDTGNVSIATGGAFPGPNYAPGRFTDGPNTTPASVAPVGLWVDQLAKQLGVADPQPFLALTGGTDYAFASAETGSNGLFNISDQLKYFVGSNTTGIDPNALIAVWGGANDLFNGTRGGTAAATNLYNNILQLAAAGGKNFLWFNLPPLDLTPVGSGNANTLLTETLNFDKTWSTDIALLQDAGINVVGVDVNSLFGAIITNPSAYGISNLTQPAQGQANVDPNTYLFWDGEHPTTAVHSIIATTAYNDLAATATPEPATAAAMAFGLVSLLAWSRVRKARSDARR